jgi:hypothetical protein
MIEAERTAPVALDGPPRPVLRNLAAAVGSDDHGEAVGTVDQAD